MYNRENERKIVYFISGGGTGGHIYPAFTIAQKLLKDKNSRVYYIGNPENLEFEIVKKNPDIEFLGVNITGMPRKLSFSFFVWMYKLIISFFKACFYIKKYKPDAVFATGGYVSAPIVSAAAFLKTPYMIHDCDSVPGLVSRLAAPKAQIVSAAFESAEDVLKSKNIKINGNPVREEFFTITKEEARQRLNIPKDKKVIFAMGGSQGARTINTAMTGIIEALSVQLEAFVILQTGKKNYEDVLEALEKIYPDYKNNKNIIVQPYFDEMVYPLKASDIVIARAGSLSLTEIILSETASILVPYPYAAQNHQYKNALEMRRKGVSLCLEDKDCTTDTLLKMIKELDNEKTEQMKKAAKELIKANPADEIIKQLKSLVFERRQKY